MSFENVLLDIWLSCAIILTIDWDNMPVLGDHSIGVFDLYLTIHNDFNVKYMIYIVFIFTI